MVLIKLPENIILLNLNDIYKVINLLKYDYLWKETPVKIYNEENLSDNIDIFIRDCDIREYIDTINYFNKNNKDKSQSSWDQLSEEEKINIPSN